MNEILLSIGHGGTDPGTVGSKYTEHDLMTIMTNSLGDNIEKLANVKVTIVDEKDKSGTFLNSYPDIAIKHSNHGNGSTDKSANGAEIIIDNNSGATKLCSSILKVLEKYGIRNRGIKNNENLYVLNYKETLEKDFNHILEWGFVTNDSDVKKLLDNKDKITTEIANLYIDYYGWTRKETNMTKTYYSKKTLIDSQVKPNDKVNYYQYQLTADRPIWNGKGKQVGTLKKNKPIYGYKRTKNGCETVVFAYKGQSCWSKVAEKTTN